MARFFSSIQGRAGRVTRLGSNRSGIEAEARGWDAGVAVVGMVYGEQDDAQDGFKVYMTGGSNNVEHRVLLGTVWSVQGQRPYFEPAMDRHYSDQGV